MLAKEQILALLGTLATASIIGVGLAIGGPIGASIMAGIGINLSSSIIHNGCFNLKERWLHSENGLVNHDLQKALARAFTKSLSSLAINYFETNEATLLDKSEKASIRDLFEELKENADARLIASVQTLQLDSAVTHFLLNDPSVNTKDVWERIVGNEFVSRYGSHLREFIEQNLLNETLIWFGEELKTDSRDCNKAWRAFQRMILEGVSADVKAVRTSQEQIDEDLKKLDTLGHQIAELQDAIDHRLPDELFQIELEVGIEDISSTLHTIARASERIEENIDVIRSDVKILLDRIEPINQTSASRQVLREEVAQIRVSMLSAQSTFDLSEVLYKVEEFLSKNPNYYEARVLRDQAQGALNNEARSTFALEEVPVTHQRLMNGHLWFVVLAILVLVIFLLLWWLRLP